MCAVWYADACMRAQRLCIGGVLTRLLVCAVGAAAVDNVILRDPPVQGVPLLAGLNLVPGAPQQPCPGEQEGSFTPAVTV